MPCKKIGSSTNKSWIMSSQSRFMLSCTWCHIEHLSHLKRWKYKACYRQTSDFCHKCVNRLKSQDVVYRHQAMHDNHILHKHISYPNLIYVCCKIMTSKHIPS